MSSVGYTIFGRPVQHEYVSNGLFNELDLNKESYLSDRIDLKKGQTLAILRRYKDKNDVEVTTVFLNTYAESYNERPGGFVGAGIAFVGKPSTTLIYHRLKHLHQQSLKLVDIKNFKFKTSKLDSDQIKLPDLSEDGLFISRTPKNYTAKDTVIGVSYSGSFYENLMSAIQGFCFNESFFSVKTAYITNNDNLLKSIVSNKSIYQIYNLLDYNYVFKKYSKLLADQKKKVEEDINAKKENFDRQIIEKEKELIDRKEKLDKEKNNLIQRENDIKELEEKKNFYKHQLESLKNDYDKINEKNKLIKETNNSLKDKEKELIQKISQVKNDNFQSVIKNRIFQQERESYEANLIQEIEKERIKNRKTDWLKVLFGLMSLGFLIISITLFYFLHQNSKELENLNKQISEKTKLVEKLKAKSKLDKLPVELSSNEFFKLEDKLKSDHKKSIKEIIEFISDNNIDESVSNDIKNSFLKRKWNFREILEDNVPDNIDKGLKLLKQLKYNWKAKDNDLLNSPLFLIEELRNKELEEFKIVIEEDFIGASFLNKYLKRKDNIYDTLEIEYTKPEEKETFQNSDPILLMHFSWMIYNYKDQKKNINKLQKGDIILVPVLK